MNTFAHAFKVRRIVSGWTIDKMVFGIPAYRNHLGWTANPVKYRGLLQFYVVYDENGNNMGTVKTAEELP